MQDKNSLENNITPSHFYLSQNYPNPFRESTTIKFCIARPGWVKLIVYDASGIEIKILVDEEKDPGTYEVKFSACSALGEQSFRLVPAGRSSRQDEVLTESPDGLVRNLKAGTYYYRLEAGDYKCEKEMELIE